MFLDAADSGDSLRRDPQRLGMGFLEMIAAMFFAILTLILRTLG